jgi:hypothetical protein
MNKQQIWDLWMPDAGAQGLSFARGRLDTTDTLIVHAARRKQASMSSRARWACFAAS